MRRFKAFPWLAALAALKVVFDYWGEVEVKDRRRAFEILRSSRGLPSRWSPAQRAHLGRVARQMNPLWMSYDALRAALPFPLPDLTGRGERQRQVKR